ncbi:MAG: spermidine/putrescine ABC transporter permease PotB, partial [Treponema sp.]|nr:spermidine/putrescine ABC transporter permease PotB [Treponema sp.]
MKSRVGPFSPALIPLYLFTVIFILGPFIFIVAMSFMRRQGAMGIAPDFNLDNYRQIFEPVYLEAFIQSIKLALICTVAVVFIGYPFGYLMARL